MINNIITQEKLKKWTLDLIGEGYKKVLLGGVAYLQEESP